MSASAGKESREQPSEQRVGIGSPGKRSHSDAEVVLLYTNLGEGHADHESGRLAATGQPLRLSGHHVLDLIDTLKSCLVDGRTKPKCLNMGMVEGHFKLQPEATDLATDVIIGADAVNGHIRRDLENNCLDPADLNQYSITPIKNVDPDLYQNAFSCSEARARAIRAETHRSDSAPRPRSRPNKGRNGYPMNCLHDITPELASSEQFQRAKEKLPLIENHWQGKADRPRREMVTIANGNLKRAAINIKVLPDGGSSKCIMGESLARGLIEGHPSLMQRASNSKISGFGKGSAKVLFSIQVKVLVRGNWFELQFDVVDDADMPGALAALFSDKASRATGIIGQCRCHQGT